MTAAVSLAMHDTETIYDDYRLIALDAEGNIIAETSSASSAGFQKLFLLDCPKGPDTAKPAQYVFQQRPKNALTFESVPLVPAKDG